MSESPPPAPPPDLDGLTLEELARHRLRSAHLLGDLEREVGSARSLLRQMDRLLARRLADEVGPHELVIDGHGFRAHRDGQGVHVRKPREDDRRG